MYLNRYRKLADGGLQIVKACEEQECDGRETVKDERLEIFYALPASSLQRQTIAENSIVGSLE